MSFIHSTGSRLDSADNDNNNDSSNHSTNNGLKLTQHLLCVRHGSEHHACEAGMITVPILQVRRLSTVGLNKLPKVPS